MSAPTISDDLAEGVALFNAHRFWHAHEAWERRWLVASGDEKRFLQGLIQLAAAYHHVTRGNVSGGVRLFDASLEKLQSFAAGYSGVDRTEAVSAASRHRDRFARGETIGAEEFPRLIGVR